MEVVCTGPVVLYLHRSAIAPNSSWLVLRSANGVMGYVQDWMKLQMATEELQGDADRMKALIESW
ncbi:hypothetical protein U9M48_042248 [Paspalum notatum var. saurae]|uniref:Uncharacterized protein n=1 Tax=Paspalum notatum var. saurae TaxID=547442 RepID=A0AAQ3XEA5_PASNO